MGIVTASSNGLLRYRYRGKIQRICYIVTTTVMKICIGYVVTVTETEKMIRLRSYIVYVYIATVTEGAAAT